MSEIDNGPGHARRATENREDDKPSEEEYQYIRRPYAWIQEPLRIPVQIHRWRRLHVQIRHLLITLCVCLSRSL